jgi:hypothetical protein
MGIYRLESLKNDFLTYGKLRTSYAEVGQAGNYYNSFYSTPSYGGGFSSGTPIVYPIGVWLLYPLFYNLRPEPETTEHGFYEIGTDLTFLNGLFSFNYTFSRQNVEDQISKFLWHLQRIFKL